MDLFTRHRRVEQHWRRDARTGAIHGANFKSQLCKSFGAAEQWCFDTSLLFGVTFPSRGCLQLLIVHGAQRLACAVCHRNVLTDARGTNMCCMTCAAFTPKNVLGYLYQDTRWLNRIWWEHLKWCGERWMKSLAPTLISSSSKFEHQGSDQMKSDTSVIVCVVILFQFNLKHSPCGCTLPCLASCPHASHQASSSTQRLCWNPSFFNVGASDQRQFKS